MHPERDCSRKVEITANGGSSIPKGQKPVPVPGRDRGEQKKNETKGGRKRNACSRIKIQSSRYQMSRCSGRGLGRTTRKPTL